MAKVNTDQLKQLDEAGSIGPADQNETTPAEQRQPSGEHLPKTQAPKRHESGAFLPAEYPRVRTIVDVNGKPQDFKMTRRDR